MIGPIRSDISNPSVFDAAETQKEVAKVSNSIKNISLQESPITTLPIRLLANVQRFLSFADQGSFATTCRIVKSAHTMPHGFCDPLDFSKHPRSIRDNILKSLLTTRPQLSDLSLSRSNNITSQGWSSLACCSNLRKLNAEQTEIADVDLETLKDILPQLVELNIKGCHRITPKSWAFLFICSNLQKLSIAGDVMNDMIVEFLKNCLARRLGVGADKINDTFFENLKALLPQQPDTEKSSTNSIFPEFLKNLLPQLVELELTQCSRNSTAQGLALLANCSNLRKLSIEGARIDLEFPNLQGIMPQLVELNLKFVDIRQGLAHFATCSNLRKLSAEDCYVNDTVLENLKGILPQLVQLNLIGLVAAITSKGWALLVNCTNLQTLSVERSKITDADLEMLKDILHQLVELNLTYCSNITSKSWALLASCCNLRKLHVGGYNANKDDFEELKNILPKGCELNIS